MATASRHARSHTGFYLLLAGVCALMFYTVLPYLGVLIMALVAAVVTGSLYDWFHRQLRGRAGLASVLSVLSLLVLVILPLYAFVVVAIDQITAFVPRIQTFAATQSVSSIVERMPFLDILAPGVDIAALAELAVGSTAAWAQQLLVPLAASTANVAFHLVLFVLMLLFMYPVKDALLTYIKDIVPLGSKDSDDFVDDLVASAKTTIISSFAAALAQALACLVAFLMLGLPAPAFWFFAVFILALLPLGSGLVTVPIAIVLFAMGNTFGAVGLLIWQVVVVSNIDNVVRMLMLQNNAVQLPALLTLVATLGGLATFGFFGVVYGPLIAVMFVFVLELYRKGREQQ